MNVILSVYKGQLIKDVTNQHFVSILQDVKALVNVFVQHRNEFQSLSSGYRYYDGHQWRPFDNSLVPVHVLQ